MTTTGKTDAVQHPDVSEISDLTEGLLPPSRSVTVRRHLDGCLLCADVRTSLEEIRGLLGTLPGPPRMPSDIAGRIDAALAAEALLDATAPDAARPVPRETTAGPAPAVPRAASPADTPPSGTTPSRTVSRETPRSSARPATDRPAGRPAATAGPGRDRARRRNRIALLSGLAATVVALAGSFGLHALGQNDASTADSTRAAASAPRNESFSGSPVEDRVHALLAEENAPVPKTEQPRSLAAEGGDTPGTTRRHREAAAVPSCVLAGTGRTDGALAAERGEYRGAPAYLLVLPDRTAADRVQAYVVASSCADTGAGNTPGELLLTTSYPRP
ncbi:hypothetical protein ACIQRS_27240 [Streptomyces termitum]|uniref:Zinc-finger domain-containing protein n=1 Tax=Streptomyces termitum TaxID=67368 RepID=A0A918T7R8_9ACTN|nr:hypothetical protein [Streptomyces termitum]GHB03312.1 hypothetical protein GCM10010305_53240 [Streptomyces termitum]